jgi:hypothetical protein
MAGMKTIVATLGVFGILSAAACGGSPQAAGQTMVLHQADAGKTFNIHGGDTVRIVLTDNYPVFALPATRLGGVWLTWLEFAFSGI